MAVPLGFREAKGKTVEELGFPDATPDTPDSFFIRFTDGTELRVQLISVPARLELGAAWRC